MDSVSNVQHKVCVLFSHWMDDDFVLFRTKGGNSLMSTELAGKQEIEIGHNEPVFLERQRHTRGAEKRILGVGDQDSPGCYLHPGDKSPARAVGS